MPKYLFLKTIDRYARGRTYEMTAQDAHAYIEAGAARAVTSENAQELRESLVNTENAGGGPERETAKRK